MADKSNTEKEAAHQILNMTFDRHDICRILRNYVEDLELNHDGNDAKKIEASIKNEEFADLEGDFFAHVEVNF